MRYFLGVDIGATKSHALIADEFGRATGFGQGASGNYEVVGWDGLRERLHAITDQALASAGVARDLIAGAGFGVAGYDFPAEREPTKQVIESLGLQAPYGLVNDTIIGLHRILDYVRVPSRFVGTETWLNPGAPPNLIFAANISDLNDPRLNRQPLFNQISTYREPGKVNLNTVWHGDIWDGGILQRQLQYPTLPWDPWNISGRNNRFNLCRF